ncbi:alpha/beta hydrolase [Micromonospora polyrhachis]|uniref:Pimeloyl-ACP methyl ester carboxylesterase n=1 Tax=Micromonospora polyrhachis TaxID=1282883 RepID=A0A7W7SL23_9ACTN|nr:alpha/beta hydrolase [Micromonospora polyrhachis]MBB4956759.1 pimeloyl-ACP methyl ester carboxylesterase [Micromonospora polyrhachis]
MSNLSIYKSEAGEREIQRAYREALDSWPVPAAHVRVPTREGETFVVVSGPAGAPPLLLLHGSGANTAMWQGDVAAWSRHFRVHALDLIGEPGLSAPSRPPLGSEAYARWLDDVLAGLGITEITIVGTSLGGWMALDYATRRPERITRLALLCPGGVGRQKMGWLAKALLLRPFGAWGMRRSAGAVAGLSAPQFRAALDAVTLTFTHFTPRTERLPIFSDEALGRLRMPVLVMVGDRDAMFDSAETARRVRRCVPHATVELLPGVGHAILDQTESVLRFLR